MNTIIPGPTPWRLPVFLLAVLAAFSACDESPTTQQALAPAPATMNIVSGDAQSAPPGAELPEPVLVRVLDSAGEPIHKQVVNFRVTAGGGSVFGGTALTNEEGIAQERWTLGETPGAQSLEARAVDAATGEKRVFATFSATAIDPATVVAKVSVSPASANLVVGGTQRFTATANNASGAVLSGQTFTWSSSDAAVATVSSTGLVTARSAGKATISATIDGRVGSAAVSVTASASADTIPPGIPGTPTVSTSAVNADTMSVAATWSAASDAAKYSWRAGSNEGSYNTRGEVSARSVTFRAPVLSDANGYWFCVSAVDAAGNSSEDAACNGFAAPAGGSTPTPAVATVAISPSSASLAVGATRQLSAAALDANGNAVTGKSFTWTSSNTTAATVSSAGLVTARAAGSAVITAAVDGKSGTSAITVTSSAPTTPAVATVEISPASASLTVGGTRQFSATAKDAAGNAIGGKTFAWTSSNTGVATVSSSGVVTARAAGSATVTATVDGIRGSATVSVTQVSSGGGAGNPAPQSGDRMLFDFRQSLQQASSTTEALDLISRERNGPLAFAADVDGRGTNAIRVDWAGTSSCVDAAAILVIRFPTSTALPKRAYVQWKQRMGRTSTGGGIGALNSFSITNSDCGNAGRKVALMLRDVPGEGGEDRIEYIWPGPAPAMPTITMDSRSHRWSLNKGISFEPQKHIAEDIVHTLYYQAESSEGANDGVVRMWINGQLVLEATGADLGASGFNRFQFPTTFRAPSQDQSEYFWDLVAWEPR